MPGTVLGAVNKAKNKPHSHNLLFVRILLAGFYRSTHPFSSFSLFYFWMWTLCFIIPWGIREFSLNHINPFKFQFSFYMGKCMTKQPLLLFQSKWKNPRIHISIGLRLSNMPNNDTLWPISSNELVVRKHWSASVAL